MSDPTPATRFRFGIFEADVFTGELRRAGVRVRIHQQPFQILLLMLERPGELLTREDICRRLWPDETFVDFEHGVNSALNRLRDALGDRARNPRFIETLARRGYRFIAPVERIPAAVPERADWQEASPAPLVPAVETSSAPTDAPSLLNSVLATREDLPSTPHGTVRTLFLLLQAMYLAFYIGTLANLAEIGGILDEWALPSWSLLALILCAAALIPVRTFVLCAILLNAPGGRSKLLRLWWFLLVADIAWSLAPFLLIHHISYGLALACTTLLVYAPFAQRSLLLMGAADRPAADAERLGGLSGVSSFQNGKSPEIPHQ